MEGPVELWGSDDWEKIYKLVVQHTAMRNENPNDIIAGAWSLAERRAMILNNIFLPGTDVVYPLKLFCWWPFKPALSIETREYLQKKRRRLFNGAFTDKTVIVELNEAITNKQLSLTPQQLDRKLSSGVEAMKAFFGEN